MEVSAFDFELPEDRIALRPVSPRDASKMLVVRGDQLTDGIASDLADLLEPGDVLVFNDTRVIPARLKGTRPGDADGPRQDVATEVTLHLREELNQWRAFAKPAKRLRVGDPIIFADDLVAHVVQKHEGGEVILTFDQSGGALDAGIARHGVMPLPPYIASKRATDDQDLADYQTVYAANDGAVAAPTAGLHFTDTLLAALDAAGITRVTLTLHVGAGTFLPIKVDNTDDHQMHAEYGEITRQAADQINAARAAGGRIVSVGTTALRLLESATSDDGVVQPFADATDIFITPGYRFKAVDLLMTNFHLPKSTLFMLVSAFAGMDTMKAAYAHAVAHEYRFYSYGDTSLLYPAS
jgi:S-adenosylmethionine:tRNA ribosyltransferase-isomerase